MAGSSAYANVSADRSVPNACTTASVSAEIAELCSVMSSRAGGSSAAQCSSKEAAETAMHCPSSRSAAVLMRLCECPSPPRRMFTRLHGCVDVIISAVDVRVDVQCSAPFAVKTRRRGSEHSAARPEPLADIRRLPNGAPVVP